MEEVWKVLSDPGFNGYYEVSNLGRIRTIPHTLIYKDGRTRFVEEHIKAQRANPKGYMMINIKHNGKLKTFKVHRLVAQEFIPNPDGLPEVNHKDENKANNSAENLEWCTHKYNSSYGTRGYRISLDHTGKKRPPMSEEQKRKISIARTGFRFTEEQKAERRRKMQAKKQRECI